MRSLLIIGLLGGGAYYAYRQGLLPQLQPVADAIGGALGKVLPQDAWGGAQVEREQEADAIKEASGGAVIPILGEDEIVTVNKYEATLRAHWSRVHPWARANLAWAAAIMMTENAGINPTISGDNGTSHGVYQVKTATAETCARAGYDDLPPNKETLYTVAGGVYFGTAEMERLSKMGKDRAWIIKAYNGGAGWEQMPESYRKGREAYLNKVHRNFVKLYGNGQVNA